MGSSGALLCCTAVVLVFLASASKDERTSEQRDVTFDLDKIMQEMQLPESFMLQKEADLTDLFDPAEFPVEQVMVSPPDLRERGGSRPGVLTPRGRRPGFAPRSFGGPPILDYQVQFPLARPTSDNLQAICLHGDQRPRYPDSYFPDSGFGQQRRRASAVNNAEAWFSECCKENQTEEVTLCCATQAWELSVQSFCEEDSRVKDRLYHCCKLRGSDRLNCFNTDALKLNPNYEATEEVPVPPLPSTTNFTFDSNSCQRTVMTPYRARGDRRKKEKKPSTSQKVDINFPPGRPTEDTIDSLCRHQKLRPLYNIKCLPDVGFELLARQAKAVNRIEKGFKKCCKKKKGVLGCADQKWREELNKFCLAENGEQVDFLCCTGDAANDQHTCFQSVCPDPHYNATSAPEELTLNKICDTHKIIKKRFPVGFPLKTFVGQCCPLSEQARTVCSAQQVVEMSKNLCLTRRASTPAVRRCCNLPSHEVPRCINKILMDAVTKAANALRQKKRKRCPLS